MKEAFEKILERLEEAKKTDVCNEIYCCDCSSRYECKNCDIKQQYLMADKCVSIVFEVEAEYVDKMCEYEEHIAPSKEFYYLTACKNRWNGRLHGCRPYCPYCGKKIKVVE